MKTLIALALSVSLAFTQTITIRKRSVAGGGGGGGGTQMFAMNVAGTARNDFTGLVGLAFVPTSNMDVIAIGRWKISGNSLTHVCSIRSSVNFTFALASVTVDNSTGSAGAFNRVDLGAPLALTGGVAYYLLCEELNGGDQFYNSDTTITCTGTDCSTVSATYDNAGAPGFSGTGSVSFVPTTLWYN